MSPNIIISIRVSASLFLLLSSILLYSQNYALHFQESKKGYLEVPHSTDLNISNAISIECWVKPSSRAYSPDLGILCKMSKGVGGWGLIYYETTGQFTFHLSDGKIIHQLHSPSGFSSDRYHHLAVSYNKAKGILKFWVNGIRTEKRDFKTGVLATTGNLYIGTYRDESTTKYFHGSIDEIRIWNFDKTEEAINQSAFSELSGKEPGLVAYFNFNQIEDCGQKVYGEALLDASSQGNNGYFKNFEPKAFPKDGSLNFDGIDDHISIPIGTQVFLRNTITVECRIKPHSSSSKNRQAILGKSYSSNVGGWGLLYEDGRFVFELADGENRHRITSTPIHNPGSWYHLAATYDREAGIMRLFVNGQMFDRTDLYTGLIYAPPFPLEIGQYPIQAIPFKGAIKEIRLWNIARSPQQLSIENSNDLRSNEPGLVAHYNLSQADSYGQRTIGLITDASEFHHTSILKDFNLDRFGKNPCDSIWTTNVPIGINDLLQDEFGRLWLATPAGLLKYDGIGYQSFSPDDSIETDMEVKKLIPYKNERFFVETNAGLYAFDLKKETFALVKKKQHRQAWSAISTDHSGNIWLADISYLERILPKNNTKSIQRKEFNRLGRIHDIHKSQNGDLWLGTDSGLILLKISASEFEDGDLQMKSYNSLSENPNTMKCASVYQLFKSKNGFWLKGKTKAGFWMIEHFNLKTEVFTPLEFDFANLSTSGKTSDGKNIPIRNLMEERYGRVLENGTKNLFMYWPALKNEKHAAAIQQDSIYANTRALIEDNFGTLWLATESTLLQIACPLIKKNQQIWVHPISGINHLLEDSFDMIWVGTTHGLTKLHPTVNRFNFFPLPRRTYWPDLLGSALLEDQAGKIWIATTNHDLFVYDPKIPLITYHEYDWINDRISSPTIPFQSLNSLLEDRQGKVWVISDWGLSYFDPISDRFFRFDRQSYNGKNPGGVQFYRAIEDKEGIIWLTHQTGLDRYDPVLDTFYYFFTDPRVITDEGIIKPISGYSHAHTMETIYEDNKGTLWTTFGNEYILHKINTAFDKNGNLKIQLEEKLPIESSLQPESIRDIYQDSKDRYWLATTSIKNPGLFMFDPNTKNSRQYSTNDGLLDNFILSIEEDEHGNIWLLTISGLSKLDPESERFTNFDEQSGLYIPTGNRNTSTISKTKAGAFLVSGINGFYWFHPDSITTKYQAPKILLKDLQIGGVTLTVRDTSILQQELAFTENITLQPNTREISISYVGLDFVNPENIRYQYRMTGLHDDWIDAGNKRIAQYSFLPFGKYTFEVKAMNGNGSWSKTTASLNIQVLPPWYHTTVAYMVYLLFLGLVLYFLWRYEMKRIHLRQAFEMKQFEAEQLQKVDQMKSHFYTNLSHEFRTPMTVILGMADQITNQPKKKLSHIARMIKRNGRNVLHLINQMLDLSKLESNTMTFNFVQGDILQYLRYLTESFHSLAASKGIHLDFYSELDSVFMDYDPDKILSIVSNLLSNAIKFTPPGGAVVFEVAQYKHVGQTDFDASVNGAKLQLKVSDTGIGIEKPDLPLIFDRFYQANNTTIDSGEGTGIGLSLTKELVEKFEGTIDVESTPGEGTEFTILLPVKQTAPRITGLTELALGDEKIGSFLQAGALQVQRSLANSIRQQQDISENGGIPKGEQPLLLVIEDSPDVIQYLRLCLEVDYTIITAVNGKEGIEKAIETIPDIIISDVMMPEKDGFEVCETLKQDERTSHIPIILLTAKATVDDRLKGLTRGADAYLSKPFDKKELFIRLRKLIQLRQTLQKRYQSGEIPLPSKDIAHKIEDIFITKLNALVNENIDNDNLGPEFLCKKMGMSRSQLHRKVNALTGKSISIYIRSLRLHKSKSLLLFTDLNISEIAYEVGFHNPSRLSEYFKEQFGISPSEWRIQESK